MSRLRQARIASDDATAAETEQGKVHAITKRREADAKKWTMAEVIQQLQAMNEGGTASSNAGELLPDIRGLKAETAMALLEERRAIAEWSQAKSQADRRAALKNLQGARQEFDKLANEEKPLEPDANLEDGAESSEGSSAAQGDEVESAGQSAIGVADGQKAVGKRLATSTFDGAQHSKRPRKVCSYLQPSACSRLRQRSPLLPGHVYTHHVFLPPPSVTGRGPPETNEACLRRGRG